MDQFDPADRTEVGVMMGALIFGALAAFVLTGWILATGGELFAAALAAFGGVCITAGLLFSVGPLRRF